MKTQKIICNFLNTTPSGYIIFRQGEYGREIEFEITDENNQPVSLSGYNVQFSMFKPDGNFVIASATVDGTKATVTQTEQMSAVSGVGYFDLKCAKDGEVIYTFNGFVQIDTPIIDTEIVESVSEVNGFVFPDDFQLKLIAGENITIAPNGRTISARGGDTVTITPSLEQGVPIANFSIGEESGTIYAPQIPSHDYSYNKVDTGQKWVDGKTIYSKVFDLGVDTSVSSYSFYNTRINNLNCDFIIECWGNSDDKAYQGDIVAYIDTNGDLNIQTTRNGTAWVRYLTIVYTERGV